MGEQVGAGSKKKNSGKPREGPGNRERERAGGKLAGMSRLGEGLTSLGAAGSSSLRHTHRAAGVSQAGRARTLKTTY